MPDQSRVLLKEHLENQVGAWVRAGLGRNPDTLDAPGANPVVRINGQPFINFSSNDSLGHSQDAAWREEVGRAFAAWPPSGTGSRLAGGHWRMVAEAEEAFARYFGYDECVFFPSGYQANLACVTGLLHPGMHVFADRRIHASMARALPLSGAAVHTYAHASPAHLERRLAFRQKNHPRDAIQDAVLSESLFSMEGTVLDGEAMRALKERWSFFFIADEAHAIGAVGEGGRGVLSAFPGLADAVVGTFGKALGFFGAFLLLPKGFTGALEHLASALMHSTALPPGHAAAILALVKRLPALEDRRERLRENCAYFRRELAARGIPFMGAAHIIGVPVGEEARTARAGRALRQAGILTLAARHPTVPHGKGLLRFNMTALHTREHIDAAVRALAACGLATRQDD